MMERRFILFVVLSFAILMGYFSLLAWLNPPPPRPDAPAAARPDTAAPNKKSGGDAPPNAADPRQSAVQERPAEEPAGEKPVEPATPAPKREKLPLKPERWIVLGSARPDAPYRMLVTLSTRGATVARIELNSPRFSDLDDRAGYLGHLTTRDQEGVIAEGCEARVVGRGTPADEAGLRAGDVITAVAGRRVVDPASLRAALAATRPGQQVVVEWRRQGRPMKQSVTLRRRPLEVVRPEGNDPLSFRLTLARLGDRKLVPSDDTVSIGKELEGIDLWNANWELAAESESEATFRHELPEAGLEIRKTYRLAKAPGEHAADPNYPAYHLEMDVELRNAGDRPRTAAYQLDGPTGLPIEGAWYASKVSRSWGAAGLRDVVVSFENRTPTMINCPAIASGRVEKPYLGQPLTFMGVDAQYFSVVLMPRTDDPAEVWFARSHPLRVGPVPDDHPNRTNTSFRLIGEPAELKPGERLQHRFTIFAGPKARGLLEHYGLTELIYYGWPIFAFFARPLAWILHTFHALTGNYGLAIILLTVLVRGLMFPVSRKQVLNAQKMQELQPEINRLKEKYKNNIEARTKAQQELFRKHNFNPLSGCLVMFLQLPVFIGLYRTLMVDVELRQAPLLTERIRWCSNLAAPDMFYDWSWLMPRWVSDGSGMFALGPYLNILPILTIAVFLWQQKKLMPPPADEQAAMQQKIMQWMMVFMGILFFKVSSGLCIYFVASSLWGLAERRLLPKPTQPDESPSALSSRADVKADARDAALRAAKAEAASPSLLRRILARAHDADRSLARKNRKNRPRGR